MNTSNFSSVLSRVCFLIAGALPGAATAVTLEVATQALSQFDKLPPTTRASTAFEKWTHDTAVMTLLTCANSVSDGGQSVRNRLQSHRVFKESLLANGSFAYPQTTAVLEKVCASIAEKGITPVCTNSTLWADDHFITPGLPLDYLQVGRGKSKFTVQGTLYCYLNKDQVQAQPFVEPLTWEWVSQPSNQSVNLPSGLKTLNMGTILVKAGTAKGLSGEVYSEPRNLIFNN